MATTAQAESSLNTLLLTLLNQLPESLFIRDASQRYLWANQAHRQLLGNLTEEQVLGRTVGELLGDDFGKYSARECLRVLETGQIRPQQEEPFYNHITLLTSLYPLSNPHENKPSFVGGLSRIQPPPSEQDTLLHHILSAAHCLL